MEHNRTRVGTIVAPDRSGSSSSRSAGQALVEFALVLPVMLLLLLMAVDFGRLFTTYIAINNAAREGAFYAAEHARDTPFVQASFEAAAQAAAEREVNVQGQGGEGMLPSACRSARPPGRPAALSCDTAASSGGVTAYQATVTVSQPFSLITPIVGELFGGSLDLTATSSCPGPQRAERDCAPRGFSDPYPVAEPQPVAYAEPYARPWSVTHSVPRPGRQPDAHPLSYA